LTPAEVVSGAQLDAANAYVVGCFDSRITFFAQQVRALELAHALDVQHRLAADARVAVIGAGAAGLTVAAALALQGGLKVRLFERADVLLPLQQSSLRRRLDPHLYEWPRADAGHEFAELPFLDWRSGPAQSVRSAVLRGFDDVRAAVGDRLEIATRHDVRGVNPVGGGRYDLRIERDAAGGTREQVREEFDVVILAVGFGLEDRHAVAGLDMPRYWEDAGVPGPVIDGKARPGFLVSGNGDGGLIDLLAAASQDFRHDQVVKGIAARAGVRELAPALMAIDARALQADGDGRGFDFLAAYDAEILADVDRLGLVDEMRRRLRSGVRLYLQTREPELLSVRTARLNRLAVYVLVKACEREENASFEHLVCDDIAVTPTPGATAAFAVDCGANRIDADLVIARRGPLRDEVRAPFANLLAGYAARHEAWTRRHPEESIAPTFAVATRAHFERLAQRAKLPPAPHKLETLLALEPSSVRLSMEQAGARWTGTLSHADVAQVWENDSSPLELEVAATPDALGAALTHAIIRWMIHANRPTVMLDVAAWRPLIERLTIESVDAGGLILPDLRALCGTASILNPAIAAPDAMATTINRALDLAMLERLDRHLRPYCAHGDDPGRAISFVAADDLRQQMGAIWVDWHRAFLAQPELLARFLGLALCTREGDPVAAERSALVGPRLQRELIRTCAMALAVATAWPVTAPRGVEPGNLGRAVDSAERTGHACAAGYIDGEAMAVAAMRHMWATDFILLPMESMPSSALVGADRSFGRPGGPVPLLDDVVPGGRLMVTIDWRFQAAAKESAMALAELLIATETDHFARLNAAVQSAGGGGAYG